MPKANKTAATKKVTKPEAEAPEAAPEEEETETTETDETTGEEEEAAADEEVAAEEKLVKSKEDKDFPRRLPPVVETQPNGKSFAVFFQKSARGLTALYNAEGVLIGAPRESGYGKEAARYNSIRRANRLPQDK